MEMYLRALNSLLRSIPPWGIALLAMAAFFMILFGIIKIVSAFRRKLTPEEQKKREIELDEAETVSKLTQNDNRNAFDRWFTQMLEEGNTKLSPFTASLFILATLILTGGLVLVLSDNVPLALGTGIICMVLPMVYWLLRRSWRLGQMRKHLPETLEAIGDAIRGGLSLEEAIQMTSEQIEDPLKTSTRTASFKWGNLPHLLWNVWRTGSRLQSSAFSQRPSWSTVPQAVTWPSLRNDWPVHHVTVRNFMGTLTPFPLAAECPSSVWLL